MTWLPEWEQNEEEEHRFSAGFVDKSSLITLTKKEGKEGGVWWATINLILYGEALRIRYAKLQSKDLDDAKREAHALTCSSIELLVYDLRQTIEQHQQRSAAIEREVGQG